MEASNLRCLLITVQGGQAILPSSVVVEVLPFASPLGIETAPHWVIGAILWRNLTTPLVSLGRLIFRVQPESDINSRIIIVNTLGNDSRLPYFGIVGTSAPRPINLRRDELQPNGEIDDEDLYLPGILSWARYQNQPIIIPDLEAIEAVLKPLIRRA
ncbi:MAG TPA: chemotaxis protein CheW [Candidatus Competibacter sp.]|jgi:chemotaxis signal transduction protein|nr:chemotaxis protein CheW [Candidatus Competibacter sp.]MCC9002088.1 chemotaxis protein CheW [Candidatus Competibacter sp.]HRF63296.1 chemotaxis protein CheW [Candidatus Competibacter sp.]HRX62127.1 chemotaxis protein CheW [Candidatus Competibacter sp.]HUM91975.1 chemotaxis protein CheW [Candidatus Competibacter sp.]